MRHLSADKRREAKRLLRHPEPAGPRIPPPKDPSVGDPLAAPDLSPWLARRIAGLDPAEGSVTAAVRDCLGTASVALGTQTPQRNSASGPSLLARGLGVLRRQPVS